MYTRKREGGRERRVYVHIQYLEVGGVCACVKFLS